VDKKWRVNCNDIPQGKGRQREIPMDECARHVVLQNVSVLVPAVPGLIARAA
jgi:hypothetical protein